MQIEEKDLRQLLCDAFDSGTNIPWELCQQEVDRLLGDWKFKHAPALNELSTDKWIWTDYMKAIKNPESFLLATT